MDASIPARPNRRHDQPPGTGWPAWLEGAQWSQWSAWIKTGLQQWCGRRLSEAQWDDVLQEIALHVCQRVAASGLPRDEDVGSWLLELAKNTFQQWYRREVRHRRPIRNGLRPTDTPTAKLDDRPADRHGVRQQRRYRRVTRIAATARPAAPGA